MKESIEQNYNITLDYINDENNNYSFKYKNEDYIFTFFNRGKNELDEIIKCNEELKKMNIKTLLFVPNKFNNIITTINETNYVLLHVPNNYKQEVDLTEIIGNNKKLVLKHNYTNLYRNNWANLWSEKLDYYEYQIRELGKDKDVILDTFGYYEAMAINAISLINNNNYVFDEQKDKLTLSHRRIFFPNYKLNFYNPLNYIFDLEIRDIAEYIKTDFFYGTEAYLDLKTFLNSVRLSNYSYQMFYARLLYPSYYFDIYDKIMNKQKDQQEMLNIISKSQDYEMFLKKAYLEISKYAKIDKIPWLS